MSKQQQGESQELGAQIGQVGMFLLDIYTPMICYFKSVPRLSVGLLTSWLFLPYPWMKTVYQLVSMDADRCLFRFKITKDFFSKSSITVLKMSSYASPSYDQTRGFYSADLWILPHQSGAPPFVAEPTPALPLSLHTPPTPVAIGKSTSIF